MKKKNANKGKSITKQEDKQTNLDVVTATVPENNDQEHLAVLTGEIPDVPTTSENEKEVITFTEHNEVADEEIPPIDEEEPIEQATAHGSEDMEYTANGNSNVAEVTPEMIDEIDKTSTEEVKTKKVSKTSTNTVKKIKLVTTTYHYFRQWLKDLLRSNGIESARFVKEIGYNGHIAIRPDEKELALKILAQYRIDNPGIKELWSDIK